MGDQTKTIWTPYCTFYIPHNKEEICRESLQTVWFEKEYSSHISQKQKTSSKTDEQRRWDLKAIKHLKYTIHNL